METILIRGGNLMKRFTVDTVFVLVLAATLSCWACDWTPCGSDDDYYGVSRNDHVAAESFSYELGAASRLRLEGINGTITVTGSSESASVTISGEKRVGSESAADAQAHLSRLEVRVEERGNEISVRTIQPSESHGRNYVVDYEIALPDGMTVAIANINGDVDLDGLAGDTRTDLVNGQIDARVSVPMAGTVELSTVNGTIDVSVPVDTSAHLTANVVNGTIGVHNLTVHDEVSSRTSLQGTLGSGQGNIRLSAVNGSIDVEGS
jgi:DUF4097 and DUF4098 domain-containing protein YvlB